MSERLPVPGGDAGAWGTILNAFLEVEHNADGTLKRALVEETDPRLTDARPLAVPSADVAFNSQKATGLADPAAAQDAATKAYADGRVHGLLATDYGAKFDGTTSDSVALQAAIDAAQTSGKDLLLPPGMAVINATLNITSPITIRGSGREKTILRSANGLNNYVFTFDGGAPGVGIVGAHFADFRVNGNCGNQTAGGGVLANGAVHCSFERMHFTYCYDWGLKLAAITGGGFGHHNKVVSCLFDNATTSAGFGGGLNVTSSDENWILATDFEFLGGASFPIGTKPIALYDQAGLQHIISCNFVGGGNNCIGIRVQNTKDTRISSSTFDGTGGDSVFIAANKCIITDNMFTGPGDQGSLAASGIHLEFNTHNNIVSNNSLETSTTAGTCRSLIREESTGGSGDNIIEGNSLYLNSACTVAALESAGTNTIVRNNIGWKTEASGAATVANGTTTIVVTHGLAAAPSINDISVTPTNNLGSAAKYWISTVTATQFTINVNADPGVTTATFVWRIARV